jgi:hypothetical protein
LSALTPELERKLGVAVERMPAFPRSVQKILELTRNINCLPKDLVGVVEKDPVMTMKILKVINSAYYGLPQKITSVGQSVVYLGINTIKNLALGFAAVGILPRMNAAGFDIQRYLLHSLVVAGTARQLATQFARARSIPATATSPACCTTSARWCSPSSSPSSFAMRWSIRSNTRCPCTRARKLRSASITARWAPCWPSAGLFPST